MYNIVRKERLAPNIKLIDISAPAVAAKSKPGQFVILRIHEKGERFPITITDADPVRGIVSLIFAEVGKSSIQLGKLGVGDSILNFSGPLGNATKIENFGEILCVGGGVMVGALLYQMKALKAYGNKITSIIGARSKEHLILLDDVKRYSQKTYIATDDGSEGYEGLQFLGDLLKQQSFAHVFAIGPTSMQMAVSEMTKPIELPTTVNLFPIMVDGTGMCGGCRVDVGGKTLFTCVDGPEFDAHAVDWDTLMKRQKIYVTEEKCSLDKYIEEAGTK